MELMTFREIAYRRPAVAKVIKTIRRDLRDFRKAKSFEAAKTAFDRFIALTDRLATQYTLADIRHTVDMTDKFYEREKRFYDRAVPLLLPFLKRCLVVFFKSPYVSGFEDLYGSHLFRDAKTKMGLYTAGVILPMIRENSLTSAYAKAAAGCKTEFRGETCNFYGLLRHMQSTDREERREAFLAWAKLYEDVSPTLEKQYRQMVGTRCKIAKRAGYPDYIRYCYVSRGRYDYTPADAAAFRTAVKTWITPLCAKLYEEQRQRLGIDSLQWYDEGLMFPDGNATPIGDPETLVRKARDMYTAMSPETAAFFDFMTAHDLFDLVTRPGKHLGGYCTVLPEYRAPFIFSNFNGTSADVDVLTHEAGHAFAFYTSSRALPLNLQCNAVAEICEIHSMSMEHFAYPYMESFFGDKADRYRYQHLCDAVKTVPYLVAVDEFQHRVYENPGAGPADWRRFWKEIEQTYLPWRQYDGNAFLESGGFWMQKQHIFLYPFYYIDYALAQLCAFSLYRRQCETGDAWQPYLKLCELGGKYGYFETLDRAGIPNPFDETFIKETAAFLETQIETLKQKAIPD
ncbi:MAG: M3 family oligoendopeptidase [Clostridia bacterium]|nr:M3 family oligoendopeptidase [Clostridia bacterium]